MSNSLAKLKEILDSRRREQAESNRQPFEIRLLTSAATERRARHQIAVFAMLAVSLVSETYGQGLIQFNNRVTTTTPPIDAPIHENCTNGPRLSGISSVFRAALMGGSIVGAPTDVSGIGTLRMLTNPVTQATWVTFRTGANAGYVAVGIGLNSGWDAYLPYGSTGLFQVVAWQGTQTSWQDAYAAWKSGTIKAGWSAPVVSRVTTGPTDFAVPGLIGLQPFFIGAAGGGYNLIWFQPHPTSQVAAIGSSVSFSAVAYGTFEAYYQWQFNGTNLPGATNTTLVFSNITPANQGPYQVIASNGCPGNITGRATLTVKHATLTAQPPQGGAFRMLLTGTTGVTFQLQGTTNFSNWTSLGIFSNQVGTLQLTDHIAPGSLLRFYRAVLQ